MLDNRKNLKLLVIPGLVLVLLGFVTGCSVQSQSSTSFAQVPAGKAYADGSEISFSHTEASDQAIAEKLTNMMSSPVLYVPALAQVPDAALAEVYVFENGIAGKGPLGFQVDVFNHPPQTEGYSPLRQIMLVKWADGIEPVELISEAELIQAQKDGKIQITASGVVVNMPFMVWSGGKR